MSISTNKLLIIVGTAIVVVIAVIAAIAASEDANGYEETNRQQIHESALTLRSVANAAAVNGLLESIGTSIELGDTHTMTFAQMPQPARKSAWSIWLGILCALGTAAAIVLYLVVRANGMSAAPAPTTKVSTDASVLDSP